MMREIMKESIKSDEWEESAHLADRFLFVYFVAEHGFMHRDLVSFL